MPGPETPPLSRRHRLFAAGFRAIATSRADLWLAPLARGRGLILTFHHVQPEPPAAFAPNRLLSITPDFLDLTLRTLRARGFALCALDDVPARLAGGDGPPFCALTFDDGYRDNAPLRGKFVGLPPAMFKIMAMPLFRKDTIAAFFNEEFAEAVLKVRAEVAALSTAVR